MKRKDLLDALEIVKPGLANREMIEQSTSFAFMNGKVVTYNDEISIAHPVEGLDIEGAIKAEELYQLLNKIKKEEIEIKSTESEILLTSGRAKAGLVLQQEIKLPLEEIEEQGKWNKLPSHFIDALKFTVPHCSRSMSDPILTCVHIQKNGQIESSDNHRITRYQIEPSAMKTFLLPATAAQDLLRYDINRATVSAGWAHFRTKAGTIFSCRIIKGDFPGIDKFLEVEGNEFELPKSLEEILDRASIFSKQDHALDEEVLISLKDNRITVRGEGDFGWLEEEVNIRYKDDPIAFNINPSLLKSILSELRSCILGENSMKFEGENWTHVVTLTVQEKK